MKFQLIFSALVVVGAFGLSWVILGESSPLNQYFLWHVGIPNAWRALNVGPALIAALAAGNLHGANLVVFYVAFAIQWSVIGLLLSLVALRLRNKTEEPSTLFR